MGRVVVSASMSLDGFIAGPHDEMDWVFDHHFIADEPVPLLDDLIAATGAILTGRRSFEVGQSAAREETSSAFGGRWSGPELVLTHRPPPDRHGPDVRFLSGDITTAVEAARAAALDRDVLVLGANVAQQCLAAELVDEIILVVLPMTLGDGVRLFGTPGYSETLFTTSDMERAGDAVVLRLPRRR